MGRARTVDRGTCQCRPVVGRREVAETDVASDTTVAEHRRETNENVNPRLGVLYQTRRIWI